MTAADDNLLRAVVRNDRHVLRHLFASEKRCIYDLRPRAHDFTLPLKDNNDFILEFSSGFRILDLLLCIFSHLFSNGVYVSWCGLTSGFPINEDNNMEHSCKY